MGHSLNRAMLSVAGAALLGAFFGGTPVRAAEDWDSVNWRALSLRQTQDDRAAPSDRCDTRVINRPYTDET